MKKKDKYVAPERTIFDGTNAEVMEAFGKITQDVRAILEDEEFPSVLIAPNVDENADKAELGKVFLAEKVGSKLYKILQVFTMKHPENVYSILDTLFCAESGTYKNRKFADTLKDFKLIKKDDLLAFIRFFT